LTVIGQRLPTPAADDAQRFRRRVALADQDGAGHQRAAADAVLTVQKSSTAIGNVVEHPVDPLVHLHVRKTMPIQRRQMEELNPRLLECNRIVLSLQPTIDHGRYAAMLELLDLPFAKGSAHR